jgi:hypothetical protein
MAVSAGPRLDDAFFNRGISFTSQATRKDLAALPEGVVRPADFTIEERLPIIVKERLMQGNDNIEGQIFGTLKPDIKDGTTLLPSRAELIERSIGQQMGSYSEKLPEDMRWVTEAVSDFLRDREYNLGLLSGLRMALIRS